MNSSKEHDNPNIYTPSNRQEQPESESFKFWMSPVGVNRNRRSYEKTKFQALRGKFSDDQSFCLPTISNCLFTEFLEKVSEILAEYYGIKKSDNIL